MTTKPTYRPDVEGLRAVAVLAVLFYHVDIWPFTGGFVGVDIFFVISGYLITKIILSEIESGAFSFREFYDRRMRRLLPALLCTVAGTYLAGLFLFSIEDFTRLSGSTVTSLLGVSNFFFWREAGYFDAKAILKPLLHTWSLAVEFQFYLLSPAFTVALFRWRGRPALLTGTVLIAVLSFAASLYMMRRNPSGAFFLTPFRVYEFAIGALVAFAESRRSSGLRLDAIYACGLVAVLFSVFAFDERTAFPKYAALLPTIGTALLIYAGPSARGSWALKTKPMQFLGSISYSLYLVHWPLVVFTHYVLKREPSSLEKVALLVATFILSLILHRYVEVAFRRPRTRQNASPALFNAVCAGAIALVIAPAAHSWLTGGWVWRLPPALQEVNKVDIAASRDYVWSRHPKRQGDHFTTGKKRIFIVGDSQAADLLNMLVEAGQDKSLEIASAVVFHECGAPFVANADEDAFWNSENPMTARNPNLKEQCRSQISNALNSALLREADAVILSMVWLPQNMKHIENAITEIKQRTAADVYVTGRKDMLASSIDIANSNGKLEGLEAFASQFMAPEAIGINRALKQKLGSHYIDLMSLLCPRKGFCHVLTDSQKPLLFDIGHLTKDGAAFVGARLIERKPAFLTQKKAELRSTAGE
ncbi:acyltransferase [Microvirga sp. ACRRW]|uniref:acyltransferase family protein n=1 Tax=Microvirga sp. ACRRW TaxID=2918205 RepID=UPI001EF4F609|nr:acyltransferase family protein [Microvirga sp. ACRRW]MCG7392593.1 acyltransferase [Microvirga sp. ACRRW]